MSDMDSGSPVDNWLSQEWPTTITRDRYGGVYSGGMWVAWPLLPHQVPAAVFDEDVPCRDWWVQHRKEPQLPVGVGATPDEALDQLRLAARRRASP